MSESIATQLKSIKEGDKDLHQHIKQVLSQLLIDRNPLPKLESYSAQQRISGGVQECAFKVR